MGGARLTLFHFHGTRGNGLIHARVAPIVREVELLAPIVDHFEMQGFRAVPEVSVAGRRADIVAVRDDALLAVELKVSAWPHALRQAMAYQVWAPEAFVALPFPRAMRAVRHRHRFDGVGVGLLAVLDGEVRTFLPAAPSPRLFPALSDLVRRQLSPPPTSPLDAFPDEGTGERFYGKGRM